MCLDRIVLERFARGELSSDAMAAAEAHLASCRRCAEALATLGLDNELLERIRDAERSREEIAPALTILNETEQRLTTTLFGQR